MWKNRNVLRAPEDGEPAAGGAAPAGAAGAAGAGAGAAGAGLGAAGAVGAAAGDAAPGAPGAPATPAADAKPAEGYWPADWRATVSKDDAKVLARLERYASPEAAMQALIAAQNRIRSGELAPVLGKNATPDQLKEYREAMGIPDTPDKYDLGKDVGVDGLDAKLLGIVFKGAHDTHQTPEQLKATMLAWKQISQEVADNQATRDQDLQKASEDTLRAEWGTEYRRNINLVHGLLDGSASPEMKDKLLGGRLADGTPIGSSPEALKMLVGLALIQNPTGVVVPGSEGNQAQGIDDEIAKIEKGMRENRLAYNKDEKLQARYRDLLGARESMKPRKTA